MNTGRFDPKVGAKLNIAAVTGAVAPNADPSFAGLADEWECTLSGVPNPGDEAMVTIGLSNYGYVVQAAVQDKWEITVGNAPAPAGGDTATVTIPGGAGSPYTYLVLGALPEIKAGTIGGPPNNFDQAILTLNGVAYQVEKTVAGTVNDMAATMVNVTMVTGTFDKWTVTIAGGPAAGGEASSLTIGANTYNYNAVAGNTSADVAEGLKVAAAGDPDYTTTRFGSVLTVTKTAGGTGVTVSCTTDDVVFTHTTAHVITGVPAQADWTVTNPGAPSADITVTCATSGITGDTATSSGTGACTFSIVETQAARDLDSPSDVAAGVALAAAANGLYTAGSAGPVVTLDQIVAGTGAAVTSGITGASSFTAVNTQVGAPQTPLATMATAIAAAITADTLNCGYTAVAGGGGGLVVTVTANAVGVPTKVVSSLFNPDLGTGDFVAVNTVPGQDPFEAWRGYSLAGAKAATGSVECLLNAGVSYDLQIWTRDASIPPVWSQDAGFGTKTIVGNATHTFTVSGVRVYAFVDNFVGGADASVVISTTN